jgi:hypothetical protein
VPDESIDDGWHLEEPRIIGQKDIIDFWPLISGECIDIKKYRNLYVPMQHEGRRLSFTLGSFLIPYVTWQIGNIIQEFAPDCTKLVPCLINDKEQGYYLLVIEKALKCLDMSRSAIEFYTAEDFEDDPPDDRRKIGSIKGVIRAVLDPAKVQESDHIFRLEENLTAIFVSEALRQALLRTGVTGISFTT